jgi:hypothetical protein
VGFDGGWLRTASPTYVGHANAQREAGRLILKPPPSVSTLAFRKSASQNALPPSSILWYARVAEDGESGSYVRASLRNRSPYQTPRGLVHIQQSIGAEQRVAQSGEAEEGGIGGGFGGCAELDFEGGGIGLVVLGLGLHEFDALLHIGL